MHTAAGGPAHAVWMWNGWAERYGAGDGVQQLHCRPPYHSFPATQGFTSPWRPASVHHSTPPFLSYAFSRTRPSLPPRTWGNGMLTFIHMLSMNKLAHGGLIVIRLRTLAGSRRAASSLLILRRHASG